MRIIAGIVVVIGLAFALIGEVAVFVRYDDLERQAAATEDVVAIRDAQRELSMWPVIALGASIITLGFLLHMLGGSVQRRRRISPTPDPAFRPAHGDAESLWRRRKAS